MFGLREYLSTLVPWWQYVLGGVYVLTILYLPTGLMGIPDEPAGEEQEEETRGHGEIGLRAIVNVEGGKRRQQEERRNDKHGK